MNDKTVIALCDVVRHFTQGENTLQVLDGVNLSIAEGELVALIGPSGSGKSTLLQIAGLLDSPQGGGIIINGTPVVEATDRQRTQLRNRNIGFIYQFHHLLPELSALENVMMPQLLAGEKREDAKTRAESLLTRLGLAERMQHLPSQMSGGEQQRVAIARAMANRPALILADEPTGNLDPKTSDEVTELFFEVAREEKTAALIATHNMALAARLHRVVTLKDGKIQGVTL